MRATAPGGTAREGVPAALNRALGPPCMPTARRASSPSDAKASHAPHGWIDSLWIVRHGDQARGSVNLPFAARGHPQAQVSAPRRAATASIAGTRPRSSSASYRQSLE